MSIIEKYTRSKQIMRSWYKYKFFVAKATLGNANSSQKDIVYWRERLFSDFITYLLPVCIVVLLPSIYVGLGARYFLPVIFDMVVVCTLVFIALNTRLNLLFRKIFVICVLYCLAIALLADLGSMGPGNIYLFAISVIVTLTFPVAIAYWSVVVNFLICSCFAAIIYFRLFTISLISEYTIGSYIFVSLNMIFLTWVSIRLISYTIDCLDG